MKRFIPFVMLASIGVLANPVRADITTRFSSSVQLSVGGASTQAERIGSSFSISGSNVDTSIGDNDDYLSAGTITSGLIVPGAVVAEQHTAGEAFSFATAFTQGDALPTSAVTVGASQNFGDIYSVAGGTVGDLDGVVNSTHEFSDVAAGGANTAVTSQFVSEVTIR